jgi:hypothetical protein
MSTPSLTPGGQEPFATQASFQSTLTAVCEAAVKLVGVDHSGLALFGVSAFSFRSLIGCTHA